MPQMTHRELMHQPWRNLNKVINGKLPGCRTNVLRNFIRRIIVIHIDGLTTNKFISAVENNPVLEGWGSKIVSISPGK